MKKDKTTSPINLLMTCDKRFSKPFLSALYSIQRNTRRSIHLFFYGDLEDPTMLFLDKAFPNVMVTRITQNDISPYLTILEGVAVTSLFPYECLLRLVVPFFLSKRLERLLYIDCDTITDGDIGELYDLEITTAIGAVQDVAYLGSSRIVSSISVPQYFYSGVLLFDLRRLAAAHSLDELKSVLSKIGLSHAYPDQDILNVWFKDDKTILPLRYNNASYRGYTIEPVKMNSLIYHYCGKIKPWDGHWICLRPLRLFWKYAWRFYGIPYYLKNTIVTRIRFLREKHGRKR